MKKVVGTVTEKEKLEMLDINGHKTALEELLLILPKYNSLYEEATNDLTETTKKYQNWWDTHYAKYKWGKGHGKWQLVFETNEVVIDE